MDCITTRFEELTVGRTGPSPKASRDGGVLDEFADMRPSTGREHKTRARTGTDGAGYREPEGINHHKEPVDYAASGKDPINLCLRSSALPALKPRGGTSTHPVAEYDS